MLSYPNPTPPQPSPTISLSSGRVNSSIRLNWQTQKKVLKTPEGKNHEYLESREDKSRKNSVMLGR